MDTHNKITRRRFLGKVVGGTTAAIVLPNLTAAAKKSNSDDTLARRALGRTKEKVTILGLGTAPVGEGPIDVEHGARVEHHEPVHLAQRLWFSLKARKEDDVVVDAFGDDVGSDEKWIRARNCTLVLSLEVALERLAGIGAEQRHIDLLRREIGGLIDKRLTIEELGDRLESLLKAA